MSTQKDVRFIAQAVNGVGVVGLSNNMGRYYGDAGSLESQLLPTTLTLDPLATTVGAFSTPATFAAVLRDGSNNPVAGRSVIIGVGSQEQFAVTDAAGRAAVTMPLLLQPATIGCMRPLSATSEYAPSSASSPISLRWCARARRFRWVRSWPPALPTWRSSQIKATLVDVAGVRLIQQSVFFEFSGGGQLIDQAGADRIWSGEAIVTIPALPPGA